MEKGLQIEIKRLGNQFDLSRIVQYLKDREKEEGGFNFVPGLYPDIEDTYYAIQTLQLLNIDVDRNNTANYLKKTNCEEVGFSRAVYMLLYLYLSLNIELPPQLTDLADRDWSVMRTLNAQYFSDAIQKLLGQPLKPLRSSSSFQFQANENLQTLRKKVSI